MNRDKLNLVEGGGNHSILLRGSDFQVAVGEGKGKVLIIQPWKCAVQVLSWRHFGHAPSKLVAPPPQSWGYHGAPTFVVTP
jgi:hypothetical protein